MSKFDLEDEVISQLSVLAKKTSIDSYKLGYHKGREQMAKEILEKLEAETDPDSWGTFALPTVRRIVNKLIGGEGD